MEEVIVSAIIGELLSRSISLLIKTCSKSKQTEPLPASKSESLDRLGRLLLRIGAIVEDAEGRRITNQAMLQQLNTLRHEMQRGHYTLDALRCHAHERRQSPADHQPGRGSFVLSRFNSAKRLCICSGRDDEGTEDLRRVLASLEASVQDAAEFVLLSGRYPPRLSRQPYSMYLLVDNCMFGRQMEMERIISFLLRDDPGAEHLGVLPVVGWANVGKSTLVEHACIDERARNHFSKIVLLGGRDLMILDKDMETLAGGAGVIKHENTTESSGGRVLIIVELDKDISDDFWRRFYSTVKNCFARDSKIIVTSRSNKIVRFGTTLPLRMQLLTREAYWYFFKMRTFGSVDVAMENPKLASIAMEMATEMSGCFMCATIFGGILRSSINIGTWSMALATYREFKQRNHFNFKQRNQFKCDPNSVDPWVLPRPMLLPTVNKVSPGYLVVVTNYQTTPAIDDGVAPKVSVQDVIFGSARPQGKFAALGWRSHIPPYYNYVFSCEQQMPVGAVSRKKRTPKVPM